MSASEDRSRVEPTPGPLARRWGWDRPEVKAFEDRSRDEGLERLLDRLMELWQEPWSEAAFGEAQMLLSRIRPSLVEARSMVHNNRAMRAALAKVEPLPGEDGSGIA